MSDEIQNGQTGGALGVRILVVDGPGDDDGDGGKEAYRGRIDSCVAVCWMGRDGEQKIATGSEEGVYNYEEAAVVGPIGEEGGQKNEEEGDKVWRCAKGLRGEGGVAHSKKRELDWRA